MTVSEGQRQPLAASRMPAARHAEIGVRIQLRQGIRRVDASAAVQSARTPILLGVASKLVASLQELDCARGRD